MTEIEPGATQAWRERAEAAEAENARLRASNRLKPSIWKRWFGWVRRREPWEQIVFVALASGLIAGLYFVAEITVGDLVKKAAHAFAVLLFGITGFFIGVLIAWAINKWRWIRERAVPAADDSIRGVETWWRLRAPDAPWTMQDALTTLAAALRFGFSYGGIIALTIAGMHMA